MWVRIVTRNGRRIGLVGFYYISNHTGEVSVLCVDGNVEAVDWEYQAVGLALKEAPLLHAWGEVYASAPEWRRAMFAHLLTPVKSIPEWVNHKPFQEGSSFYWTTLA